MKIQKTEVVKMAEVGLIGSALYDPTYVVPKAVGSGVLPDWFSDARWRNVWSGVLDEFTSGSTNADQGAFVLAVAERVRKITARLNSREDPVEVSFSDIEEALTSYTTSAHLEYHIEILRSEVMVRRLGVAQGEFHKALEHGMDAADAIADLNSRITTILSSSMGAKSVSPGNIIDKVLDDYRKARRIRITEKRLDYTPGIPLPWQVVNMKANGVQEGLYYVGARPSVGKTAFLLNFIRYWCENGVKVGFDSLDMAIGQLMKRPLGEKSRVSFNKASFGTTTQEDIRAMEDAAEDIRKWPLMMIDFRDVDKLRAWAVAMRAANKIDVLVVDFVQLLRTRQRYSNTEERLEYVSGVLKSIAVDLSMPVIALSQLNRECEKDGGRVPTASDLRGSGALEQDAFAVWILHCEKEVKSQWMSMDATGKLRAPLGLTAGNSLVEFKGIDPVRFIIAKNQNGQAGPDVWFPFIFYKKYCCLMLGDWEAQPVSSVSGYGVTAKTTQDFSPLYARVHSDWRHDALEAALRLNGTLIDDGGMVRLDTDETPPSTPMVQHNLIDAPEVEPDDDDDSDGSFENSRWR